MKSNAAFWTLTNKRETALSGEASMAEMSWSDTPSAQLSFEELSVQSLDAAIELDRLQHGQAVDVAAVNSLAKNLGFQDVNAWPAEAFRRFMDTDIYYRAMTRLNEVPPSTVTELAAKLREIADTFTRDVKVVTGDDLKKMRDFCLALHRELLAETYDRHVENMPERS